MSFLCLGEVSDGYDGCFVIFRVYWHDSDGCAEPAAVAAAPYQFEAVLGLISPP
jgi:hypothetical protein